MNTLIKTISFKTKKVAYGLSLIKNTLVWMESDELMELQIEKVIAFKVGEPALFKISEGNLFRTSDPIEKLEIFP